MEKHKKKTGNRNGKLEMKPRPKLLYNTRQLSKTLTNYSQPCMHACMQLLLMLKDLHNINNITQYHQRKRWTSNLSWYSLIAWCIYPRTETLVYQQLSLHQLQYHHPSQRLPKRFFRLHDVTRSIYLRIKSLVHVLSALCASRSYQACNTRV